MTSAWAEIDQKDDASGLKIDDGFPVDSHFDPIGDGEHVQDAVPLPQKRGGLNPKVVLAVFSVVGLAAMGLIGVKVYSAMFPARAVEQAPVAAFTEQSVQEQPEQELAEGQTILGNETSRDAVTPVDPAASEPATISEPLAQAATVTQAPPASGGDAASQGAALAAIQALDSSMNSKFAAVDKRMDEVEGMVARLSAAGAAAKPTVSAAPKSRTSQGQKPQSRRPSTTTAKAGKPAVKDEEKGTAGASDSSDVANYKLRAVYPPQGEDRQAWVVGKSGDVHAVVKGTTLAGMRVIRVESDQVVTDRGTIR